MSFDDGFIRTLSLREVVNDFLATGEPLSQTNNVGLRNWRCAPFAIWSCQVSGATDIAAYCTEDGYTRYFKLTNEAVEKESECYWEPHYLVSSFSFGKQDETTLKIETLISKVSVPNILVKKEPSRISGDVLFDAHIEAVKKACGGNDIKALFITNSKASASHFYCMSSFVQDLICVLNLTLSSKRAGEQNFPFWVESELVGFLCEMQVPFQGYMDY